MDIESLTNKDRLEKFLSLLTAQERNTLRQSIFDDLELANTLVESAVGYFYLPFSLAPGIRINDRFYPVIPLSTEETSVVAALTKNIMTVNKSGFIKASAEGLGYIGQIHFSNLNNLHHFETKLCQLKNDLIQKANEGPAKGMVKRSGGVKDIQLRFIQRPDGGSMGIVHILMDTVDAMGANIINQTCEYISHLIEEATEEKSLMSILSNLNTEKLITVEIVLNGIDTTLAKNVVEASLVAQLDPYRAVTHNKGIMNGMDAVCIATGNDWRALEAGMHGFAARDGGYRGISTWTQEDNQLKGKLVAPIAVGIVGGVTKVHPMAALSLRCMGVKSAKELAFVMGAVGLIQNFAALRALVSEGISKGHMRLHLKNLIKQTNATSEEQDKILKKLEDIFRKKSYVSTTDVHAVLHELRS